MAVRTITRDQTANRTVLVWPKGVGEDDVRVGSCGAQYGLLDGEIVVPAQIPVDVFKSAFGFVPKTGSKGRYIMRKAIAPKTAEAKITAGIKALVNDILNSGHEHGTDE